jgi:5-methylthioribose kinase
MEQLRLTEAGLCAYLRDLGLLSPDEPVEVESAGDGNINWVRRVRRPRAGASFVVKQARPELERFPQYQAPTERIVFEARYYERARKLEPLPVCPQVLHFDERERVLVLEDLGRAERLDDALARGADVAPVFSALGSFLGAVHAGTAGRASTGDFPNDAMRRLHGDHIFRLPLRPNDFPLSDALCRRAEVLRQDAALVALGDRCHARYLEPRGALVHGDVQAGNVLLTPRVPKLLDAEIAHVGDPAFDLGTLIAHALLWARARSAPEAAGPPLRAAWQAHQRAAPRLVRFEAVARYAGFEMLRRTIGAACSPAVERDEAAQAVLETALRLIQAPPDDPSKLAA